MTNVLLLSPYADVLLPTFRRAGDTVTVFRSSSELEWSMPAEEVHDWIVLYGYPHRIADQWVLERWAGRIINLHISLLPWNRGADPNFWSWREDTPKGVTIHQVDEGLDTGPVLAARNLYTSKMNHTLATSYKALSAAVEGLFATDWVRIRDDEIGPRKHGDGGSSHRRKDIEPFRWALEDWSLPCAEVAGLEAK